MTAFEFRFAGLFNEGDDIEVAKLIKKTDFAKQIYGVRLLTPKDVGSINPRRLLVQTIDIVDSSQLSYLQRQLRKIKMLCGPKAQLDIYEITGQTLLHSISPNGNFEDDY